MEGPDDRFREFCELLGNAERVIARDSDTVDNSTRRGRYISIRRGLSTTTWFVGMALDQGRQIVEQVN